MKEIKKKEHEEVSKSLSEIMEITLRLEDELNGALIEKMS